MSVCLSVCLSLCLYFRKLFATSSAHQHKLNLSISITQLWIFGIISSTSELMETSINEDMTEISQVIK